MIFFIGLYVFTVLATAYQNLSKPDMKHKEAERVVKATKRE